MAQTGAFGCVKEWFFECGAAESLLDLLEYGQQSHGTRWNVRALIEFGVVEF